MAKKILIVEDEVHVSSYLENLFQDQGYQTLIAADSEAAWGLVQGEKPDLITLDLQMPGEHGTRLYRRLRKNEETKGIPIIVISGQNAPHRSIKADKVVAIVEKPFDATALAGLVQDAIGNP